MIKYIDLVLIVLCALSWQSVPGLAQGNGTTKLLNDLIKQALQNNPAIKAAERRWRAAQTRPSQVSTLPDPVFSYTRFGESVETRVGPQEQVFSLSQRLPFPGKLSSKELVSQKEALIEQQKFEMVKRDVVYQVKAAYYDLYRIDHSLEVLDNYLAVLEDFTQVAQVKYATGQGIQANVLKAQVEISDVIKRRIDFDKMRQSVSARLNALLGRSQERGLPVVMTVDTQRVTIDETALLARAKQNRQEIHALNAGIAKTQYMRRLAKRNFWPDLNVQANLIDVSEGMSSAPDAGKNAWSVMLGINLPIWFGQRQAAVREADELTAANRESLEDTENKIAAEIRDLVVQVRLAERALELYEQGLLTQAETSLESALASYRTGNLDFMSLLDAERMLLNLNLGYVKEQAHYRKQLAALERATGGTESISMTE